jgi:hypothetical protein
MRYINFFLIIIAFCSFAAPASAQHTASINQPLKITEVEIAGIGADTTQPKIMINPGIIYCDSCVLNFKCIPPDVTIAPNYSIDPGMIVPPPIPDTSAIARLMIVKPPYNIDPEMIYNPKFKFYDKIKGKLHGNGK